MSSTFQETEWQKIRNRDDQETMVKVGGQWVTLQESRQRKAVRKSFLDWLLFGSLLAGIAVVTIGCLWAYCYGCQRILEGVM